MSHLLTPISLQSWPSFASFITSASVFIRQNEKTDRYRCIKMVKERSTEELIKELKKQSKKIKVELSKRTKKKSNPFTSSFETIILNNALTQNETLGRLLERTEGIKSINKCVYILTAEVSVLLTIAIAIAIKLIVL